MRECSTQKALVRYFAGVASRQISLVSGLVTEIVDYRCRIGVAVHGSAVQVSADVMLPNTLLLPPVGGKLKLC